MAICEQVVESFGDSATCEQKQRACWPSMVLRSASTTLKKCVGTATMRGGSPIIGCAMT